MLRTPLLLAAVWAQVYSLLGPAFILCVGRDGRVCVEYVGEACTRCADPDPAAAPPRCGCCHDGPAEPDECPPGGPHVGRLCDCTHIPLADGDREPCVPAERVSADQPVCPVTDLPPPGFDLAGATHAARSRHRPPGHPLTSYVHLTGLLRC